MIRVERIQVTPVRVPLDRPIAAAGKVFRYRDYVLVELDCSDGCRGIGFSYAGTGGGRAAALAAEELLVPEVIGADPAAVEATWDSMYRATLIQGRTGLVMNGLSAIDIALWDCNARRTGVPLHRHLGGPTRPSSALPGWTPAPGMAPAYASGGYYAEGKGPAELGAEIAGYVAMGFRAVKIKAGRLSVREERARVQAVRAALGPDRLLLIDLYNAFSDLSQALPYVQMFREFNPYWIEDPFLPDDLDNFARLARRITEPVATGEFHYTRYHFKQIISMGAASILQAEAPRCGGVTEWRRIAALASAHGVVMSPCWFHQLHVSLLSSIANGLFVEVFPDDSVLNFSRLIDAEFPVVDGALPLPQRPGVGFDFVPQAVAEFSRF